MTVSLVPDVNSEDWNTDTVLARLCRFMFRYTVKLYMATWPFRTLIFLLPKFSVDLTMTVSWFQRWAWILFIGNSWWSHFVSWDAEHLIPQRYLPQVRIRRAEALECGSVVCYPGPEKASGCTDVHQHIMYLFTSQTSRKICWIELTSGRENRMDLTFSEASLKRTIKVCVVSSSKRFAFM